MAAAAAPRPIIGGSGRPAILDDDMAGLMLSPLLLPDIITEPLSDIDENDDMLSTVLCVPCVVMLLSVALRDAPLLPPL